MIGPDTFRIMSMCGLAWVFGKMAVVLAFLVYAHLALCLGYDSTAACIGRVLI